MWGRGLILEVYKPGSGLVPYSPSPWDLVVDGVAECGERGVG